MSENNSKLGKMIKAWTKWVLVGWLLVAAFAGCAPTAQSQLPKESTPGQALNMPVIATDVTVIPSGPTLIPEAGTPALAEKSPDDTNVAITTAEATVHVPTEETNTMSTSSAGPKPSDPAVHQLIEQAKEDLAGRLEVESDQIDFLEFRKVVWPDTSMGCLQPDLAYAQVLVDGFLIRLGASGRMYFYHGGGEHGPFLCEQTSQMMPQITPKGDELLPPPGFETD